MPSWSDWIDDLFGGTREKVYYDKSGNKVRMVQDANAQQENERRGKGDYPHYTHNQNGDESWHYSDSHKKHSDFWSPSDYFDDDQESSDDCDDSNDDSDSGEDSNTGWLF